MIVEVFQCPKCKAEAAISDLNSFSVDKILKNSLKVSNHKIVLLCLECNDVPVMQHLRTEVRDQDGNVGAVIV